MATKKRADKRIKAKASKAVPKRAGKPQKAKARKAVPKRAGKSKKTKAEKAVPRKSSASLEHRTAGALRSIAEGALLAKPLPPNVFAASAHQHRKSCYERVIKNGDTWYRLICGFS